MHKHLSFTSILLFSSISMAGSPTHRSGLDVMGDTLLVAKADTQNYEMSTSVVDKNPFTVQVSSYISEQDAIQHVARLKKIDKNSFYFPTFTRGQVWFKVCSGRFSSQDLAENHRKTLVKKSEEPFAVVISLQASAVDRGTASTATATVAKSEVAPALKTKAEPQVKVATSLDLKKEATDVPIQQQPVRVDVPAPEMKVQMLKPEDIKAETKKPMAEPDFQYTVQVASFPSQGDAESKSVALKSENKVLVKESLVNGKKWYRVYIGQFDTKREAEAYRAVFSERTGDKNSFVKRLEN